MAVPMQDASEIKERKDELAPVTLTQAAADKVAELMEQKGVRATHGLRVFIRGSSCSGLVYGMAFDSNPQATDCVFEDHGLRVIVDPQSIQFMAGSNIDYIDDPAGGGFHIDNPNVVSACSGGGCSGCR